jgi:hypothetical protein
MGGLLPLMADSSRPIDEPIPLPDGGELRMLLDTGYYIQALPKAKHQRPDLAAGAC